MRQREDGFGLSLRIGVENVGLNVAFILEQAVEEVDRLPDAARVARPLIVRIGRSGGFLALKRENRPRTFVLGDARLWHLIVRICE
jgi:hypothetical protein